MISIKNLSKKYKNGNGELAVFKNFNIDIGDGEFLMIYGRSGCGKSTLLNIIGLVEPFDEGELKINGVNINGLKLNELAKIRNKKLGYIYQNFYLIRNEKVLANIELPMKYAGVKKEERQRRAEILLKIVGLSGFDCKLPSELSGGEMQRVAIARALANRPRCILADEPTGNLDLENRNRVMALLKAINKSGRTIIMVTHDMELLEHADRVIKL